MSKSELTQGRLQTRRPYFPARHWRQAAGQRGEHSLMLGNEFKRSVSNIVKSLEIALRSFNRYGG